MGWMNDTLAYIKEDPINRKYHQGKLTFSLMYAFSENFVLPLSHDEVVHGKRSLIDKMPGDLWQKFANLRALLGYMYGHPGKKLLFMGGEFAQWIEWNHNGSLDWHLLGRDSHRQLQDYVRDLNHLYASERSMFEVDFDHNGFQWLDFHDAQGSTIAFMRKAKDETDYLVFALNFTPIPRPRYRIGVPDEAFFKEVLNSDSASYGGSNLGNYGGVNATKEEWAGWPCSIEITLPPLGVVILKPQK
jgi:1,4-alpha-glucan branching enzyme